jgi:anaerobic magnesium-protoporphyrin IX monomethyl ester cyclase
MAPTSQPPLGLAYLAAFLRKEGFSKVSILDTTWESLKAGLENVGSKPDIIGISLLTPYFKKALVVAEQVRKMFPEAILVVGGPHPTVAPEHTFQVLKPDFAVTGEGEVTFCELVKTLASGENPRSVKGICLAGSNGQLTFTEPRKVLDDLDELPFPARDLLPMDFYLRRGIMQEFGFRALRATTLLASRGCPFDCLYCTNMFGRRVRYRSQENVILEMELLVEKYGVEGIFIVDDTFTINRRWVLHFCEMLQSKGLKLNLAINSRVDCVDPEYLTALRSAGVVSIAYGIEAGSQKILDILKKRITLEQIEAAVRYTKEAGIHVKGYFMIGSPGETLETMYQTVALARRLPFDQVQFSITTPYPGTDLWEMAVSKGLIDDPEGILKKGFFESGVMHTGSLTVDEILHFHRHVCKPLVYRKILAGVVRDWRSFPYFLSYVGRRLVRQSASNS